MGFPKLWSKKWWMETLVRRELKKMAWLRKYPMMVTVLVGVAAALATAFGNQEFADFLLKISKDYTETGFGMEQFVLALVAVYQGAMIIVKLFRDKKKKSQTVTSK